MPVFCGNRGFHSEPEDVLWPHWPSYGIFCFPAGCVLEVIPTLGNEATAYTVGVRIDHVPEEDNYAHSEVRMYSNGSFDPSFRPNALIRKFVRTEISRQTRILKMANTLGG